MVADFYKLPQTDVFLELLLEQFRVAFPGNPRRGGRMLVLSRKVGEDIVIGDNIRLKVVAIQGGKVRIGISAPKEVTVDRQEIHEKRNDSFSEEPTLTSMPASVVVTTVP